MRRRDAGCGADARDALDAEGTQRRRGRRGRGGLRGGFCDNTTACRCLVLLLLSQRQLPSASVFDHEKAETRGLCMWWLKVLKKGRCDAEDAADEIRRDSKKQWSIV